MSYFKSLTRFKRDTSGNFAIFAALVALPLALAVGLAVDYTEINRTHGRLQDALDASVLAAGVDKNLTSQERIQIATDHFAGLTEDWNFTAVPTVQVDNEVVSATISVDKPTYFGGLLGQSTVGISVATEIKYSVEKAAEVALVLDYSGSMNTNNKWSTMRDAAKDLVDVLSEDGTRDDIKFALAPFSRLVHTTLPEKYVVGQSGSGNWTGCTQDRKWPHNTTDLTPNINNDDTKWGLTPSAKNKHCNSQINRGLTVRPLTNQFEQVKTWLDGMSPGGMTHISLGLSFGWHLVSPNPPFEEGVAYDDNATKKFIVLLTDGAQTSKAWGPSDSYNVGNGEENLEDLCTAIKSKDVQMVTIAFDLDDIPTKNRLRDCATNPGYFFEAESNAQLSQAFDTVAALIQGSLHVSK